MPTETVTALLTEFVRNPPPVTSTSRTQEIFVRKSLSLSAHSHSFCRLIAVARGLMIGVVTNRALRLDRRDKAGGAKAKNQLIS